jgi:hypothetical protein
MSRLLRFSLDGQLKSHTQTLKTPAGRPLLPHLQQRQRHGALRGGGGCSKGSGDSRGGQPGARRQRRVPLPQHAVPEAEGGGGGGRGPLPAPPARAGQQLQRLARGQRQVCPAAHAQLPGAAAAQAGSQVWQQRLQGEQGVRLSGLSKALFPINRAYSP